MISRFYVSRKDMEDAADVAIYDTRKADLIAVEPLPVDISMAILRGESRLRAVRKWRGLTQSELAGRAGLTQRVSFRSGESPPDSLCRYGCKACRRAGCGGIMD
jgi:hypothetical protein